MRNQPNENVIVCAARPSCGLISHLYYFPHAAITDYNKDLKGHTLVLLQFCRSEGCRKSCWARVKVSSPKISSFPETLGFGLMLCPSQL